MQGGDRMSEVREVRDTEVKDAQDMNIRRMRKEIEYYSKQLVGFIDKVELRKAWRSLTRRSDRLYAYHCILRDACCGCFRSTGSGRTMKVWGFNGRVWEEISMVVFRDAVGDAVIRCSGDGDYIVKSDWNNGNSKMFDSARDGALASPLRVKSSVVGFRNGVWDFSDIDHPVRHEFKDRLDVVSLLGYDYDSDASCPRWDAFLHMMLPETDILVLQKFLGLGCVWRRSMSHRVEESLWLIGSGANGKSTIGSVLRAVYGEDNIGNKSLSQMLDHQPISRMLTFASMNGKVFNWTDEVDVSDMTKGSDSFKKLCSGEPQDMRGIGENIGVAYDIPFLIFSMNQMPQNRRMDDAFRRRMVEIRFMSTVREQDMDKELQSKLMTELPGIRNWMMEGYRLLRRDGFLFSHTTDETYMEQNEQYFDIFCKKYGLRSSGWAGKDEKPVKVLFSTLWDAYSEFCKRRMYECGTDTKMGRDLNRLGFQRGRSGQGRWYYVFCDEKCDWMV